MIYFITALLAFILLKPVALGWFSICYRLRNSSKLIQAPAEKVPPGYYLMMGDNRNGSFDSRGWGLVPRDAIVGRSEAIWLPMSRWRATR